MKLRKGLSLLTALVMLAGLLAPPVFAAVPGLSNFRKIQTYDDNFTDLSHWSGPWVVKAYDYGIVAGSGTAYGTLNNMSIQDALVVASKMHGIYQAGDYDYGTYGAYPDGYITYALENNIIDSRFAGRYTEPAGRGELAYMWSGILPKSELSPLNPYVPFSDVSISHPYYAAIKLFYEAGIATGSDGKFNPDSPVIRGECAIMFVRLVNPSDRSGYNNLAKPEPETADELLAALYVYFMDELTGDYLAGLLSSFGVSPNNPIIMGYIRAMLATIDEELFAESIREYFSELDEDELIEVLAKMLNDEDYLTDMIGDLLGSEGFSGGLLDIFP